jgi:hypothetical protein
MSVRGVKGRQFSPLDKKLQLRGDQWSEGAARVAARQGLQARSFQLAADSYSDAVGSSMSGDSIRRLTEGWGQAVAGQRDTEVAGLYALDPAEERKVAELDPLEQQANLSTDGGMLLVRGEGWKEVKLVTVSAVRRKRKGERNALPDGRRYAPWEPRITLERHSYQAALCDADTMEGFQYLEGCRRGLPSCAKASAVSDAAEWIQRITETNFPHVTQIVDWFHAAERLWAVGKACFPEEGKRKAWVQDCLDDLWAGRVDKVFQALERLDLASADDDDLRQMPGYFQRHRPRMAYHQYRVAGYPIGSGTVESGVNIVVHHRLKRQGRGWNRDNAQAMLAALSELHSGRFEWAWQRTQSLA